MPQMLNTKKVILVSVLVSRSTKKKRRNNVFNQSGKKKFVLIYSYFNIKDLTVEFTFLYART